MLGYGNKKIKETGKVYGYKSAVFDLPAGHTCPMANLCHSRTEVIDGKWTIVDYGKFRCYATKAEAIYPNTYRLRWSNFIASQKKDFSELVVQEIRQHKINLVRIHGSGDFYDFKYFMKWYDIALENPDILFFGYSKQASFVHWLLKHPLQNFRLQYSMGGKMDEYAIEYGLPACYVETEENKQDLEFIPLACSHEDGHYTDDFERIMRYETFKIAFH